MLAASSPNPVGEAPSLPVWLPGVEPGVPGSAAALPVLPRGLLAVCSLSLSQELRSCREKAQPAPL